MYVVLCMLYYVCCITEMFKYKVVLLSIMAKDKCSHRRLYLFSEYYNLYCCSDCGKFWIPTKNLKHYVVLSEAIVAFSPNDDRIMNICCPEYERIMRKEAKNRKMTKEERNEEKFLKQQAKAYRCKN
jgi:hypothetical protein